MSNTRFESIGLSPELCRAVSDMNYTEATGIQAGAIPLLMQGLDVIGRSSTGTGKTAAFGIPAVERVSGGDRRAQVLVLSPTRELAMQISEEMRKYAKYKTGISVAAVYGGAPMDAQITQLRTANIVIGTPGRVMDHMRRRTLRLDTLKMVVLDEADEMLNMGFLEDIQSILSATPEDRQTVLFSATMPPTILKITSEFLKDPQTVHIRTPQKTIETIDQYFYQVPQSRKMDAINLLLQMQEPSRSVIFCNTKSMVDDLVQYLGDRGFQALGLHGDMKQSGRTQVMQSFRNGKASILVATDVAARGIDVEDIEAVYNFDIPQEFEYYIHRIGRTGRAGKSGTSHTLVCGFRQLNTMKELRRYINADIREAPLPSAEDILRRRQEHFSAKVAQTLESGGYEAFGGQIDEILQKQGCGLRDVACALAQIISSSEKKTIPVVKATVSADSSRRGGKRVVLNADIGSANRIGANFIVGAIVDSTGLPSRSIGRIDIFDDHTLIEMFENDALTVLNEMSSVRIRGCETHFTLSTEKPRPAFQGNRRPRSAEAPFASRDRLSGKPSRRGHRRNNEKWSRKQERRSRLEID